VDPNFPSNQGLLCGSILGFSLGSSNPEYTMFKKPKGQTLLDILKQSESRNFYKEITVGKMSFESPVAIGPTGVS